MNGISIVILIFSVLGAVDLLIGNKIGIGKEFQKAFLLFSPMATTMLGMLVISPALGEWMRPFFESFYTLFGLDPSIISASLFANNMGGTAISQSICKNEAIGNFNAYVVSSMMGCAVSYTIPFSLGVVKKEQQKGMFFGLICGVITVPIGCFVSGLLCKLPIGDLLFNLLPLLIFSAIVAVLILFFTGFCIKLFSVFGFFMKTLAMLGLIIAIFTFLTKIQVGPQFGSFENAAYFCANACVTLSGALPLMHLVSKLLNRPVKKLGVQIGLNSISAVALLSTPVTSTPTFGVMDQMDPKGTVLNSAFAVSAAFAFGGQLAFTMAFDENYVVPMIVGKLISGVCAVVLALFLYRRKAQPAEDCSNGALG